MSAAMYIARFNDITIKFLLLIKDYTLQVDLLNVPESQFSIKHL